MSESDLAELEERLKSGARVSVEAIEKHLRTHTGPRTWTEFESQSGVHRSTIWRLCQPEAHSPKPDTVIMLARALGCPPLDLLAKTESETKIEALEAELVRARS